MTLHRDDIDAVIFDAGGVLLLPDVEVGREAIKALGHASTADDWHRAYYAANGVLDEMDEVDWPLVRRSIASALGISSARLEEATALIEDLILSTPWVAAPNAAEVLGNLARAGYQLAVVSNAFGTVEVELEQAGICSVSGDAMAPVRIVVDSHLVGFEKPDPRIFAVALDALGVDPTRCIYVGDTVKFDILGAQAAGMHPVHIDPFDFCSRTHRHIGSLTDLESWLVTA